MLKRAPSNNARLLAQTQAYPHRVIGNAATKAFHRHLWYFLEHLVGFAFFDDHVDAAVKKEMVKNLQHLPKPKALPLKRLEGRRFNHQSPLDTFVTQRTAELFDVLVKDGQERATSFLVKEPSDWSTDLTYLEMQEKAHQMKVVNNCAERGIALVEEYNSSLTKEEEQKQFLLRLVDLHRKQFPVATKATMMKLTAD